MTLKLRTNDLDVQTNDLDVHTNDLTERAPESVRISLKLPCIRECWLWVRTLVGTNLFLARPLYNKFPWFLIVVKHMRSELFRPWPGPPDPATQTL